MTPKRIVLLVEGQGDVEAGPVLLKQILRDHDRLTSVVPDPAPMRVGDAYGLAKDDFRDWKRHLQTAARRPRCGGCILLLDGDGKHCIRIDGSRDNSQPFCPVTAARHFSAAARSVGAGAKFSVAIAFAMREFESWLIAGAASLAGKSLPSGLSFPKTISPPDSNTDESPRDAKGWFKQLHQVDYRPTQHQAEVTAIVAAELGVLRQRQIRSFDRFEHAVCLIATAVRDNACTVSPPSTDTGREQ